MYKRGISQVIAVVFIVLIVLAAIAIIWAAVLPILKQQGSWDDEADLSIDVSGGYTFYDKDKDIAFVKVKRGEDGREIDRLRIIFSVEGVSEKFDIDDVPGENSAITTSFNFTYFRIDSIPDKVGVAPVYDGKAGKMVHEVRMPVKGGALTQQEWEESDQESKEKDFSGKTTYWYDGDGDGYGNGSYLFRESSPGDNWYERDELIANNDCCDDSDRCGEDCSPGIETEEDCGDGYDNDCDGRIDCGDMDCFLSLSECDIFSYWKFDEANWTGEEGEVKDEMGNDNGTAYNADTVKGLVNNSGLFDGESSYISLDEQIGNKDIFTISLWFKTYGKLTGNESVIYSEVSEFIPDNQLSLSVDGSRVEGDFSWTVDKEGGESESLSVSADVDARDGEWHHMVFVKKSDEIRLYVDGEQLDGEEGEVEKLNALDSMRIGDLYTRGSDDDDGNFHFNGTIDEFIIYERAFLDREVRDMFEEYGDL